MPLYPTCSHIKEGGAFCQVAAVRNQRYCDYHLMQRLRTLRRARALRDNAPYRVDIQSLDNPYAVRNAITEVVQALGSGQLDPGVAGKMLYGIQLVRAENKRIAQLEAAAKDEVQDTGGDTRRGGPSVGNCGDSSPSPEPLDFEKKYGIQPGTDLDALIADAFKQADDAAADRQPLAMPTLPPGVRPGSAEWRVYREECCQTLQLEVKDLRYKLREYFEQKREESRKAAEEMYKEAGLPSPLAKKPPAATHAAENKPEVAKTA